MGIDCLWYQLLTLRILFCFLLTPTQCPTSSRYWKCWWETTKNRRKQGIYGLQLLYQANKRGYVTKARYRIQVKEWSSEALDLFYSWISVCYSRMCLSQPLFSHLRKIRNWDKRPCWSLENPVLFGLIFTSKMFLPSLTMTMKNTVLSWVTLWGPKHFVCVTLLCSS